MTTVMTTSLRCRLLINPYLHLKAFKILICLLEAFPSHAFTDVIFNSKSM